jgi:AcrR family transcriptional regulator
MPEKRATRRRRGGATTDQGNGSPPNRLELVHEAARLHFSTRGYEAASMREIAADAGINIATLYFYCSTKEQLLFDVLINAQEQLAAGLREQIEAAGASWTSRLSAAIVVHIKICAEQAFPTTINRVDMQRLTDEHRAAYLAMRDGYERELRDLIRGGVEAGEFRPVDPKLITFAILGIGHTVGRWYSPDGPLTPEQIAEQYVDFILAGLRADATSKQAASIETPNGAVTNGTPGRASKSRAH